MPYTIATKQEGRRGCGYRQAGGIYLVCDGEGRGCGRIPFPLTVCPTCNQGVKPARGWTWVDSGPIIEAMPACKWGQGFEGEVAYPAPANYQKVNECERCPMRTQMGKIGLIWVGEKFYPTPEDFLKECKKMGISRRIPAVPNEFILGETWVWLSHRKCIPPDHESHCASQMGEWVECDCDAEYIPGIFHVFKPERVEYVVKEDDEEEKLQRMSDRGITLVKIERLGENLELEK